MEGAIHSIKSHAVAEFGAMFELDGEVRVPPDEMDNAIVQVS